jgi:aspartate aminotransferase-like enzyme
MVKGKPWGTEEEKQLKALVKAKMPLSVIAAKFKKSEEAMRQKIRRLGLEVVEQDRSVCTTTSIPLPKELPSVEEALKMLAKE